MPYTHVRRPSLLIHDVLTGKTPLHLADKSIQSACTREFYLAACEILDGETSQEKRRRLDRVPEYVREPIEAELKRLIKYRAKAKK